jgi:hypothetical protein
MKEFTMPTGYDVVVIGSGAGNGAVRIEILPQYMEALRAG